MNSASGSHQARDWTSSNPVPEASPYSICRSPVSQKFNKSWGRRMVRVCVKFFGSFSFNHKIRRGVAGHHGIASAANEFVDVSESAIEFFCLWRGRGIAPQLRRAHRLVKIIEG